MRSTRAPRTYVERIEIRGNARTRDYVIRREFDVSEGDAFNQVLIQRAKRRLEALDYFDDGRNFDGAGLGARPGRSGRRRGREVDRRVLDRRRLHDRRRDGRPVDRRRRSPSATSSAAASSSASRRAAARTRATSVLSFTEPYFLGRRIAAGFDIYPPDAQLRRLRQRDAPAARSASACRSRDAVDARSPTIFRRKSTSYDDDCDSSAGVLDPSKCNVSLGHPSMASTQSPWIKSSVSGALVYNTIDDMKNPHAGIYRQRLRSKLRASAAMRSSSSSPRAARYYQTLSEELDIVGLVDRRRRPYRGLRRRRAAHVRPVQEQRPHDPRLRVQRHRPDTTR